MSGRYTVLHLITGLDVGGAELALAGLVLGLEARGTRNIVVSMIDPGAVAARITGAGIPVESLHLQRGTISPRAVSRLRRLVDRVAPDVMHTWMYHADLLGALARGRRGRPALVWSVRASNVDMRHYRPLSALTRRACACLSRRPDAVLANSTAGVRFHQQLGYRARRWTVIPNGIDIDTFRPNDDDRRRLRAEIGIPPGAVAVGLMGRLDPMKGHAIFLEAAARLLDARPAVQIVMAGLGVSADAEPFRSWLIGLGGGRDRVHLLGRRDDMPSLQRSLDVACSSSLFGEGFPNVVAEAMASGVPVVSSDVGDAARVVGSCGVIVPPGSAGAMADACLALIDDEHGRQDLAREARARIVQQFDLRRALDEHDRLYRELIDTAV